jgi:serine/threonine-protein kinase
MVVGTPEYLSPERAITGDVGDPRSDQYSLACVVYEALAGVTPHASDRVLEAMRARALEAPQALDDLRADVPHHVAAAVSRALSPNPSDRFPDVESFSNALVTAVRRL